MASGTQVCDLTPYALIRFAFGYHTGTHLRKWSILSKLYSVFIVTLIVYFMQTFEASGVTVSLSAEYIIYVLTSMKFQDRHVYQFYQRILSIDSLPVGAEVLPRRARRCQISIIAMLLVFRAFSLSFFCFNFMRRSPLEAIPAFFYSMNLLALDVSQLAIIIIYFLLYLRVRIIKETMKIRGFDFMPMMQFSARKYVQMYEDLMDSLAEIQFPLKFVIVISLCFSTPRLISVMFNVLSHLKESRQKLYIVMMVLHATLPYACFVCGVALLDLVRDELHFIKMLTIVQSIKCRNERRRGELQLLRAALEHRPLRCSLWGAVPLSLKMVFSTVSFFIVTTMAIVQIKINF